MIKALKYVWNKEDRTPVDIFFMCVLIVFYIFWWSIALPLAIVASIGTFGGSLALWFVIYVSATDTSEAEAQDAIRRQTHARVP